MEVDAIDYLLKPFEFERFYRSSFKGEEYFFKPKVKEVQKRR
jgi:response regulator of citrate/malate metabolism